MKWQSIPSWLIILLCTGVGAFFAFLISNDPQWPGGPEPTRLPPLPTSGATIHSFDTRFWFKAYPTIQATDGQIYRLTQNQQGAYTWESNPTPLTADIGKACSPENIGLIEEAASAVIECRSVVTQSEWCPGNIVSIAITDSGEVWRLAKVPPCIFLIGINLLFLVPVGFVFGIIIVAIRKFALTRFKSKPGI